MENNNQKKKEGSYNSIVTIVLIVVLIAVRLFINNYPRQNIVIAWINFFSMFYVLWRIYYQVNTVLLSRNAKNNLFKRQYKSFKRFSLAILLILAIAMCLYTVMLFGNARFYLIGSCINDILSLCALLFSIEDETITNSLIQHYRYS